MSRLPPVPPAAGPARPASKPAARSNTPAPPPPAPLIKAGTGTHVAFEASLAFFLAPLAPFLRDPDVSEIMVNVPNRIYVEKAGRITLTSAAFANEVEVQAAA